MQSDGVMPALDPRVRWFSGYGIDLSQGSGGHVLRLRLGEKTQSNDLRVSDMVLGSVLRGG